jgi:hypothetical protein
MLPAISGSCSHSGNDTTANGFSQEDDDDDKGHAQPHIDTPRDRDMSRDFSHKWHPNPDQGRFVR